MAKAKKTSDYNGWKLATFLMFGIIVGYLISQVSSGDLLNTNSVVDDDPKVIEVQVGDSGSDVEDEVTVLEVSADDDAYLGDVDAPIVIVEFSDYQCSYCQRFHSETFDALVANYVDTGKVKFVYRDYPLVFHANAYAASSATECAGEQDSFWEMHDIVFDNLSEWSSSPEPDQLFATYAADMGLDIDDFESCYANPETEDEINADLKDGLLYGVRATPTFFINGQKIEGAQPYSVFESVLESMLAELE